MPFIKTRDGTDIYYKDWGKGPAVTFSHGWPLTADAWDAQMVFLGQRGYRVIAHDRRGHGRAGGTGSHGAEHVAFARHFGELEDHPVAGSDPENPGLVRIYKSPDAPNDRYENSWHTDATWREKPPFGCVLRCIECPPVGGDTMWANMVLAYEHLPAHVKQQVQGLRARRLDPASQGRQGFGDAGGQGVAGDSEEEEPAFSTRILHSQAASIKGRRIFFPRISEDGSIVETSRSTRGLKAIVSSASLLRRSVVSVSVPPIK